MVNGGIHQGVSGNGCGQGFIRDERTGVCVVVNLGGQNAGGFQSQSGDGCGIGFIRDERTGVCVVVNMGREQLD